MKHSVLIASILFLLSLTNCANRGTPSGGEKDVTPPKIVKSVPENFSTNFNTSTVKIHFNEYIKLDKLQKQLIISPPMQTPPEIKPLGGASKFIEIKIFDTLQANTTYAINFGQSIVDNNEGNRYPYYSYVFSTGKHIDSLSIKGTVADALDLKTDNFISVMLYERDSTYTDSVVFNQKPKYVTSTLDSVTSFKLNNLKAGNYLLTALKESNNNYTFEPKSDKIGFYNKVVTLPADTSKTFNLKMFKEVLDFKVTRPAYNYENKIEFGYEGELDNPKISILSKLPDNFEYRITKPANKDTLNYWYKPKFDLDSLLVTFKNKTFKDTLVVKLPKRDADSLVIMPISKKALLKHEDFKFTASLPITAIDNDKIIIIDNDSTVIKATSSIDKYNNITNIKFDKKQNEENGYRYGIQFLPGAITDFYGNKNDTLNFKTSTKPLLDYGAIRVNLVNAVYPMLIQLTNDKNEVKAELYATEAQPLDFQFLEPGTYYLRAVFDTNGNKKYDTGNFLLQQQPERVSYPADPLIEVTAYADKVITFTLVKE